MNLDDAQKKNVAGWIQEGLKLSDIQKRIGAEFGQSLTYMEVRLLVDDLKLVPKDPIPPPAPPPTVPEPPGKLATGGQVPAPAEAAAGGLIGARVTVGVDTVARPGAMVSGSVTFSDGQKATWYMDPHGRLGVAPEKPGYKPSAPDVQSFQMELEKELAKFGY